MQLWLYFEWYYRKLKQSVCWYLKLTVDVLTVSDLFSSSLCHSDNTLFILTKVQLNWVYSRVRIFEWLRDELDRRHSTYANLKKCKFWRERVNFHNTRSSRKCRLSLIQRFSGQCGLQNVWKTSFTQHLSELECSSPK